MMSQFSASKNKIFRRTVLASLISLGTAATAQAAFVRSDIDYQYFRDFAENKGQFTPGARNIEVFNKDGQKVGTMMENVPMPDLSPVTTNGVATLVEPQYLNSVEHNSGYGSVRFGTHGDNPDAHQFDYRLVDRNDYPTHDKQRQEGQTNPRRLLDPDYHAPRLEKMVTEVAPAAVTDAGLEQGTYANATRFPVFVRAGGGNQWLRDPVTKENTHVERGYQHLTGGGTLKLKNSAYGRLDFNSAIDDNSYGPMPTYAARGDSGSGIWAYDTTRGRWVLVSTVNTYTGDTGQQNSGVIVRPDFILKQLTEDTIDVGANTVNNGRYDWTPNGNTSSLTVPGSQKTYVVPLLDSSLTARDTTKARPSINHGKSLRFSGQNGTLNLQNDVHQGAGALHFDANFTVSGSRANTTWVGAGVDVAAGKTVNWRVHNPAGDRLSKVGAGTLRVEGEGHNRGSISVGDGTVVLAQKAGKDGKQAFSEVGIVSGRSTVILAGENQVNPDNIYFGFRGGRLDVNGHDLTFGRIQNVDKGARIVNNHADKAANITLSRQNPKLMTHDEVVWGSHSARHGLFEYINQHKRNRTDYFLLRPGHDPRHYFPTQGNSNEHWEFLSSDREEAIKMYLARENAKREAAYAQDIYHGYFGETETGKTNGKLNVTYRPVNNTDLLGLTGGMKLNGNLSVQNGTLLLSGSPLIHARDRKRNADIVRDNEWQNSNFTATHFEVGGSGVLKTGRNADTLTGNLKLRDNGRAVIGYVAGETPVCVRSDFDGKTTCSTPDIAADVLAGIPVPRLHGTVTMGGASELTLGRGVEYDRAIAAERGSRLRLKGAHWKMPANSTIGSLDGAQGGQITLNTRNKGAAAPTAGNDFRTLTVNGDLSGEVRFNYLTDVGQNRGDHVVVNGLATGNHTLAVRNSGAEPTQVQRLTLLTLNHGEQQAGAVRVNLVNQNGENHVDAGALRYTLASDERNRYYLYNEAKEAELARQREQADNARLAEAAKKLADAEKARADAEKLAQQASTARDAAVAALAAADAAKRRLEADKAAGEQALRAAQAAADEARRRADAAQAAQAEAERLKQAAQTQRDAAEAAKNQAQNQLAEAQNRAQTAEAARDAAQRAAQTAREQAQNAQRAQTAAESRTAQAERDLAQARAAQAAAEEAKRAAEEAKAQLERNQGAGSAQLTEAQNRAREAQAAAQQAEQRAREAQAAVTRAQSDLETARRETQAARDEAGQASALAESRARELAQAQAERQAAADRAAESERRLQAAEEAKRRLQEAQAANTAVLNRTRDTLAETERRMQTVEAEKQAALAEARRQQQAAQDARALADAAAAQARAAEEAKTRAEAAKAVAETARSEAEIRRDAEVRAKEAAQAAQARAEAAQRAAEAAKAELERTQGADASALAAARTALTQAQQEAGRAAEEAQNARQQVEQEREARARAEAALQTANSALQQNQAALTAAEQRAADAEQHRQRAEAAAQAAVSARDEAVAAQARAEQSERDARAAQVRAESLKNSADAERDQVLAQARTAEQAANQARSEAARLQNAAEQAETARAEAVRTAEEAVRRYAQEQEQRRRAEAALADGEQARLRAVADKTNAEAETQRQRQAAADAQTARAAAEAQTRAAEAARVRAETVRAEAEAAFQAAVEAQRVAEAAKNGSEQQLQEALVHLDNARRDAADKAERLKLAEAAQTAARAEAAEAERLRGAEQQARERAETAARAAETARQAAEAAQTEARAAQARAESLKNSADAERDAALAAAETARQTASVKIAAAEQALAQAQQAETARAEAVDALKQAQARFAAEHAARTQAEADLLAAQAQRSQEAANRQTAEAQARAEAAKRAAAEAEARRLRDAAAQAAAQKQQQAQLISRAANTALSEVSAQSDALVYAAQGIDARLAETGAKHDGIWATGSVRQTKHASENYRAYSQTNTLAQFGADKNTRTGIGDLTVGGALSHVESKRDYAENVSGKGRSTLVSAYGKLALENGMYLTAEAGYGRSRSEIGDKGENAPVKRHIAHAAAAVGGNIKAGDADIRPEVGVRYYHVGSAAYDLHDKGTDGAVAVRSDSLNLVGYQAGVRVSQTFTTAQGVKITPHWRTTFHDIDRTATVAVNGHRLNQRFGKYWENEAGVGMAVGNWNVSAQAAYSKGSEKSSSKSAGVRVGYRW